MRELISAFDFNQFVTGKLFGFNAAKAMAAAWNCGENIILFGAGGYGKSDAAILLNEFLHTKGLVQSPTPYVLAFGQGMTEERLLGGLDVKSFQERGEINFLLANAFVSHEIVIFEELWDAHPAVLLILKDILQSRTVRMGNQVMPIKTKMVIACTNRSEEEVVSDNSTEALMQRFVFSQEVVWTSWEKSDYLSAFCCATGRQPDETMHLVAEAAAISSKGEAKVSPRTAGKALKSVQINGIESLRYMRGFTAAKEVIAAADSKAADALQLIKFDEMLETARQMLTAVRTQTSSIKAAVKVKTLKELLVTFQTTAVRDGNVSHSERYQSNLKEALSLSFKHLKNKITQAKAGTIFEALKNAETWSDFDWDLIRS